MSIPNPNVTKMGRPAYQPLLRSQIEEAQRHTNSNLSAARWLGTSYRRYKRFAELYGLFEGHLNISGVGIDKGWSMKPTSIPLKDILAGNHPDYSLARLKNRLLARKKLIPVCNLCGFDEKRITDGQVPLIIDFLDGNRKRFALDNLQLLCYNCLFLTSGAPQVVNRKQIQKSFLHPDSIPKKHRIPPAIGDSYDPTDTATPEEYHITLTEAERQQLLQEG